MHVKSLLVAAVAGLGLSLPLASGATTTSTLQKCYNELAAAKLLDIIALPGQVLYEASVSSYWATTAQLRPWLIVQPRTAAEVALCVRIISAIPDLKFAVRSGGHTNWAGANNIDKGITIDLSRMNGVSYDAPTNLASIQPGGHWKNVYATLDDAGVVVAGGRDGNVGVAGFFLGGGNSYYATRTGLSCNTVRNYEVVLANGTIINANNQTNSDLFIALKGGSNNFGIVTRFDVEAWPNQNLWGGNIIYNRTATDQVVDAFTEFTTVVNDNLDSTFVGLFTYTPDFKEVIIAGSIFNIDGVADGEVFDSFRAIEPQITSSLSEISMTTAAETMFLPPGEYATWYTTTYKNDARISKFAARKHEELVAYLKTIIPDGIFTTQVVFQPFPRVFAEQALRQGGNVLGMESFIDEDAILLLFTSELPTNSARTASAAKMKALFQEIENYAASLDSLLPFRYLNYADPSQNPLRGYGEANLAKIKAAAAKYDPKRVFQTQLPGGFKVSKA